MAAKRAHSAVPAAVSVVTPDRAADLLIELESAAFCGSIWVDIGSDRGELVFHAGNILRAKLGAHEGQPALLRILAAVRCQWTLQPGPVDDGAPTVSSVSTPQTRNESRQLHGNELCSHASPLGSVLRLTAVGTYVRDTSDGNQSRLLRLIDGRRTLTQLLELAPGDPVDVLRQVLGAIERGLIQLPAHRNSLFPLAATEESSGFMPCLPATGAGRGFNALPPAGTAFESECHPIGVEVESLAIPIANSNAARDEPFSEPHPPPTWHGIGRYEILLRIGSGGKGTVYLCRPRSEQAGFRRLLALKLLRCRLGEDARATREFMEEARISGTLHHANVVGVSDAGFQGQRPYLVMDYVEGCSLRQLMQGSSHRSPHFLLPIVLDALAGLHAVHSLKDESGASLNLVHGDVSPGNLLVGVDGACRLADFGVTRIANYTRGNSARGKLGYVAPERIIGHAFDRRADIFSAGVVLYNCLTGTDLFASTTVEERMSSVCDMDIVPPSQLGAESSPELDRVILRALSRDPTTRYADADAMSCELRDAAMSSSDLATSQEIAAWVREAAGHELALRWLSVLDYSRGVSATTRESPPSRLPLSEETSDNIPIALTRISSRPSKMEEGFAGASTTEPIANRADVESIEAPVQNSAGDYRDSKS